jgi:hypothetical protein
MNQPGGWPRPETGWRLTTVRFEFSVLCDPRPVLASWAEDPCSWRVNPPGLRAPLRRRMSAWV